jgi:hypothetical protein
VRANDDEAKLDLGFFGTVSVPTFLQGALGMTKSPSVMDLDEECYVGKNGSPGDECVDFDPIHTPKGKN